MATRRASTDEYTKKRDFARTPEPAPKGRGKREKGPRAKGPPRFVVHRHEARNLHYDLRLEIEGALASWAVPKGFSYDPKEKRLAVRTEDHPLEYFDFAGVIPKGEYGAGTMGIWDRGTFRCVDRKGRAADPAEAVAAGELKVVLGGRRLRGEWHLVRTKGESRQQQWLLFKSKDRYAAGQGGPGVDMDLSAAREAPPPDRPRAMEPAGERAPFSDPGWVFEVELRGRRVFARKLGDQVDWRGLGGKDARALERKAPEMTAAVAALRAESAVVDGVLVALDQHGRPDPDELERRLAGTSDAALQLYCLDLLHFDGLDLRELPLAARKQALARIVPSSPSVLNTEPVVGSGERLAAAAQAAGLAALIGKRSDSRYHAGPSEAWCRVPLAVDTSAATVAVSEALARHAGDGGRARAFPLSNPDKVFWPAEGYTKADLADYYEAVAEWLLPYLHNRPVHMLRYPDGIEGEGFYQQQPDKSAPDWVEMVEVEKSGGRRAQRVMCNDRRTLAWLVNLGSIDLHPWLSRRGSLDRPDWLVLDLDPKDAPFRDVVRIARTAGKVLRGIGLRPCVKTSGKTGIHVHTALVPELDYTQVRMFGEGVARCLVREHPDIATVERVVGQREGKVYVDFGQNRRGATVVPPYVVRPVPGASVSAPLDWDELEGNLEPGAFTIRTMPQRLARVGDLFAPALSDRQDLAPAIAKLRDWLA